MHDNIHKLVPPPRLENAEGKPRRVGVELEISGLELDVLAGQVADFLGLQVEAAGRYERVLSGDPDGDWVIELDFNLLKKLGREPRDDGTMTTDVASAAEYLLAWAAEALVPLEIVSPPLPLQRLSQFEGLIERLRQAGAKGTSDSLTNAFGLQFNPELPSFEPRFITASLRAFVCLYDWLFARADIDMSRRVTSYVDPFPGDYVRKIIAPDYRPQLPRLIDDYLADNPTRNRALDMLPLFAYLDEDRVRAQTDDELIKARPTFHYRLPDCDIHTPGWGLHVAWNDWVEVERLAADETRLKACCTAYQTHLDSTVERLFGDWAKSVEREWLGR